MTFKKNATTALALGGLSLVSGSAVGQQFGQSDFVIVASHIDNVRQQTTIFQAAFQCTENPACVALAEVVSAASGVPVNKIVAVAAKLSTDRQGEGTFMNLKLPDGYAYCSSSMRLTSIVPHDGDRGSTFLGRADADGLYSETWTPVMPAFQGSSWVEGDLTVVGVRSDMAAVKYMIGTCQRPGRAIFYCRGGGCEGGAVDNGQSVNTSSPPGPGSRN
jgi:hypothetical protein